MMATRGRSPDRTMPSRDWKTAGAGDRRCGSLGSVPLRLVAENPLRLRRAGHGSDRRLLLLFGATLVVAHAVAALALVAWPGETAPPAASRDWAVTLEPAPEPPAIAPAPPLPAPAGEPPREAFTPPEAKPQVPLATQAPPHPPTPLRHAGLHAPPAERRPPARPAESERATVATARPVPQDAPLVVPALVPPRPVAGMQGNRPPAFPERSRQRREQGRVLLRVDVSADGVAVSVAVAESSGYKALDQAAAAAVRQWRFVAATRGGTAVAAVAEVPVQFTLAE